MENKFIELLADVLEIETNLINESLKLDVEDNWDSIAILSTIALIDDAYEIQLEGEDLRNCSNPKDLYDLINKTLE
jgi:acyl carrier protein|tara:strand:+ start:283 stop:510 length:228 start_codon:yes stop_codon:yes gene_type:complete